MVVITEEAFEESELTVTSNNYISDSILPPGVTVDVKNGVVNFPPEKVEEEKYDPMKNFVPGSCEAIPAITFIINIAKEVKIEREFTCPGVSIEYPIGCNIIGESGACDDTLATLCRNIDEDRIMKVYQTVRPDEYDIKLMMKYIADFQKCAPVFRDSDGNKHRLCSECIIKTDYSKEEQVKLFAGYGIADMYVNGLDGVIIPRGLFTINIAPSTFEVKGDPIDLSRFIAEIAKANPKNSETFDFRGMMVSVRVPADF